MWSDSKRKDTANADAFPDPVAMQPKEIEVCVVLARLELHNKSLPCGPKALRKHIDECMHVRPLPSERSIARMLARNGLTYGRTGWYDGDEPDWIPVAARTRNPDDADVFDYITTLSVPGRE